MLRRGHIEGTISINFSRFKDTRGCKQTGTLERRGGIKMESLYQTDLYCIDGQLESLLTKLKDATPSERRLALLTLERTVTRFLDRVDAVDQANSAAEMSA